MLMIFLSSGLCGSQTSQYEFPQEFCTIPKSTKSLSPRQKKTPGTQGTNKKWRLNKKIIVNFDKGRDGMTNFWGGGRIQIKSGSETSSLLREPLFFLKRYFRMNHNQTIDIIRLFPDQYIDRTYDIPVLCLWLRKNCAHNSYTSQKFVKRSSNIVIRTCVVTKFVQWH